MVERSKEPQLRILQSYFLGLELVRGMRRRMSKNWSLNATREHQEFRLWILYMACTFKCVDAQCGVVFQHPARRRESISNDMDKRMGILCSHPSL
jgi:hypothetical protein